MESDGGPDRTPPEGQQRPRRPLLYPTAGLGWADPDPGADPHQRRERAYETAAAVLQAGAADPELADQLVRLDETLGLEALRELWAEPEDDGLPAALWTLYLLRAWLTRQASEAARIYAAGRTWVPVPDAVAGVPDRPAPEDLTALGDSILGTALHGDPAGAMERAAAVHRVLACGRFAVSHSAGREQEARLAEGNLRAAARLEQAAGAWRGAPD
ncbi:hypothetical protein EV189_2990 [Motilibacter rhizosphaerae]|uniref:Uncharacterized protein n=1 Tax=Motilibacter rhizosphaerae TaxID=598652 RepID=A0A4Q7NQI4_9ACTN|nr:hypothetical protein [Motilibacter rhizosphaerae]RZS87559.1 hypothetical protein EV189_2990 [Motilibacter rhizosphaerae]